MRSGSRSRGASEAQAQGYTVVDASSVIATHLSHGCASPMRMELLGHEEVQQLLKPLGEGAPKLIEDLVRSFCR